jgi:signal transduction histidine kinase
MKMSQKSIRVLLIEDDSDDYRLLMRQLGHQAHAISMDWAENMTDAARKLSEKSFDVILTDLSLPECQGMDTVEKLRRLASELPIIVLTSLDDDCMAEELLEYGSQDYLVKGELSGRSIIRAIVHAIQRQRMQNELIDLMTEREEHRLLLRRHTALLKKKNRRLKRLYKTGQEFVDNVSHDFRTPLTVIKDYVAIVREGMVGDINDEQRRMLDKVSVRADDLNNMVDDLLDVSKLEAGLLGAWRRNLTVPSIMERVEAMLRQRAEAKGVDFQVEFPSDLPDVYCDIDLVGRVITNLGTNAIKFCGADGKVRLWAAADRASHQVVIGVTDNGPGMSPESLSGLFKRFSQLDNRVKTTDKGFGLGLNIANQFCRLNLGEIKVESCLGKGSSFSFDLPVAEPAEVLCRWLKMRCASKESLQLVEIVLSNDVSESSADDFDRFIHNMLRKQDLLFRIDSRRWLLVMTVPRCEADRWENRVTQEFAKLNRNRPMGPLPDYRAELKEEWGSVDDHEAILNRFKAVLREGDPARASHNPNLVGAI